MKAYRIGRKPAGLWINKTPPIRGGLFHNIDASKRPTHPVHDVHADSSSDDASDRNSPTPPTSRSASVDSLDKLRLDGTVRRRRTLNGDAVGDASASPSATTPAEFIDWAVQQGIDQGLRDYPSLDLSVQQDIVTKYRELHQKVIDEGLYDCPYREYAKEMARYSCLFIGFLVALRHEWYVTSAFLLGLFWVSWLSRLRASKLTVWVQHQIMFTAHDAGHRAITHIFAVDTLIGMFIADFCCGLSIGWWKSSHNVHHLVTNQPVCSRALGARGTCCSPTPAGT